MKIIRIIFFAALILSVIVFASFGDYSEISNYDIVSGIAIDLLNDKWTVTCEICVPSQDNSFASEVTYVKGEGYTLENAFDDAALKSANTLYTESAQLYLINRNAADNNCLREYLKSDNVNMRAVALWSDIPAADVFKSDDSDNKRAKSLAIAQKIKNYSKANDEEVPKITLLLKNKDNVYVSENKTPERNIEK